MCDEGYVTRQRNKTYTTLLIKNPLGCVKGLKNDMSNLMFVAISKICAKKTSFFAEKFSEIVIFKT